MTHIFSALIPVFSLIMIGYFFKKIKFPSYDFWQGADKLTYYVLMPSLLVYKLSSASLSTSNNIYFVLTALLMISIVLIILLIIHKIVVFEASSFTSIVQGGIRFNTYVFLALVDSIFADEGLVLAAIILTFVIPYINIICISVFAFYLNKSTLTFFYVLKSILTNPLIIACFIGGSINFLSVDIPVILDKTLEILSQAALPLGLLSVGFGLVIKEIKSSKKEIFTSNVAKFIISPIVMYALCVFFNLDKQMTSILIIFSVLPTAPSAFVFARQLGGNVKLMSSIITVETLFSVFMIILVLQYFI